MSSERDTPAGRRVGVAKALTIFNVGVLVVNIIVTMQASPGSSARTSAAQPRIQSLPPIVREEFAQGHTHRLKATSDGAREDETTRVSEARVKLTEKQLKEVLEEVYREERLWRRTRGVLQALRRLQTKGMLPELSDTTRDRIVAITRNYAGKRARLERTVMSADVSRMQLLRDDLISFDHREMERIQKELSTFLNAAEAMHIVRAIVPGTS